MKSANNFLNLLETPIFSEKIQNKKNIFNDSSNSQLYFDKNKMKNSTFETPRSNTQILPTSSNIISSCQPYVRVRTESISDKQDLLYSTSTDYKTSSVDNQYLNLFKTPQKRTLRTDSFDCQRSTSRILSNKLLKKSIQSAKSSSNVLGSCNIINNNKKNETCILLTLVEGRGLASGEVGMTSIDIKRPEFELSQFSDSIGYSRTLSKLYLINPIEIIFPHTMCENGVRSKLFQIVSDHMAHCTITTIHRRYFNDKTGMEIIQHLCHKEYIPVTYECREKYYALSTCAALIKYVEFIQNIVFAPSSLKIVFAGSIQTMMLDISTVRNLELVENTRDLSENGSLLNALNFTKTIGGYRLLRVNILQPSYDLPTILSRFDCVGEIMNNSDLFFSLKSQVGHFVSLDHLLSLCVQLPKQQSVKSAENTITQVIALKHVMELIPTLRTTLKSCRSPLLIEYRKLLDDCRYDEILSLINVVVHEDVHFERGVLQMRTQKLFAIKDGVNVILDVARRSYSEQIEVLRDEVNALSEEHGLSFRVAFNNNRGFFIQLPLQNIQKRPRLSLPFIKICVIRNIIRCTTEKITKLNERLKGCLSEIYLTAELVLSELIKNIRVHMGVLYRMSEIISTLDLLISYAHVSKMQNYIRPEFTNTLALKSCRNPLHDRLSSQDTVANHVFSSDLSNFTVITGANMSGKSLYLRQIALIQVMAQIGCFVPAVYASFRLTDHLFTRIGVDDDIQSNSSTFTIEMREMSYIIHSLTNNSLILVDELGRGTSVDEGIGICFALCEHLLQTKAFTFIATHFMELTSLEDLYPNVQNVFFEVQNTNEAENGPDKLLFTYKCIKGRCPYNTHGLKLAKLSNLPKEIISEAENIYNYLDSGSKLNSLVLPRELNLKTNSKNYIDRNVIKVSNRLSNIIGEIEIETPQLKSYLQSLQSTCKSVLYQWNNS